MNELEKFISGKPPPKLKKLMQLVEGLNCNFIDKETGELTESNKIKIKIQNDMNKTTANAKIESAFVAPEGFTEDAQPTGTRVFHKFENAGESVTGIYEGLQNTKGLKGEAQQQAALRVVNEETGEEELHILPFNFQLNNYFANKKEGVEVCVLFEGKIKHPENAAKTISQYRFFTKG